MPPSKTNFLGVTFSPDDTFVYYVAQTSDQPGGALYQIPLPGGAPKKMPSGVDSPVTLSPDGKWIACFWQDEKDFRSRLVVLPIVGGEMSVIEPAAFPDHAVIG